MNANLQQVKLFSIEGLLYTKFRSFAKFRFQLSIHLK
jgi:hypothetical protein